MNLSPPSGRSQAQNADLERLIEAWPNLAEAIRAGIVAMVRAFKRGSLCLGQNEKFAQGSVVPSGPA